MNFESIKFCAQTEAESILVQNCLFALGYKWADTQDQVQMKWSCVCWYSTFEDGDICRDDHDVNHHHRLVTLSELTDMVILDRNDVNDANYSLAVASDRPDYPVFKSSKGIFHTYSDNNNKWIECNSINEKSTGLKALPAREAVPAESTKIIKVKGLEDLIEGPAALQAALNGQTVQFSFEPWEEKHWDTYYPQEDEVSAKVFFTGMSKDMRKVFFRMKPKTISINGIELPAPNFHKPNDGCSVWWLDDSARFKRGYHGSENFIGDDEDSWAFGWWDSEKKIEQVVAALRKVFEVQP
ncbi:conserved hypothetical protein [Acinetobacter proteolyticus]|uniref:Uncharacterized protein n=1 Tax=Acinetobacter proteolyticus TaxID=1776741 RepID=A0A653KB87_9GAMM|nr:hypothetical protein [Acinetobacter proteolyticus]VXA58251.1 conserved hypothetical protein [Acinetobacter proteolyticus]